MTETETDWHHISARMGVVATPTPLLDLADLARRCGVARISVKDESRRPLGNFKALGGIYAGLRALARSTHKPDVETFLSSPNERGALPVLLCASDGNHGLAVATAAKLAGTCARVYLHEHVPAARAERIANIGGTIIRVPGTYDDAVAAAATAAARGDGLLIADTTAVEGDGVVSDVMAGYRIIATEIETQLEESGWDMPTHLFVQAGVGGLAAAMADGLRQFAAPSIIVVEPDTAACVGAALAARRVKRIDGDLKTVAEMLSCGEASAPALDILLHHNALALAVGNDAIERAVNEMHAWRGPVTTASGATGLAGLIAACESPSLLGEAAVAPDSHILLIVTEGPA